MNATSRKKVSGEIRDKDRTMLKLIRAVGELIRTEGYTALGVNNIANKAEVNKKLIYRYFGTVNNLIEIYLQSRDYWIDLSADMPQIEAAAKVDKGKTFMKSMLRNHFERFFEDSEMQRVIVWELSEKNKYLKEMSAKREAFGEQLFQLLEPNFKNSNVDFRASIALMTAGIVFIVLQAKTNGCPFGGINVNDPADMQRLMEAMDGMTDLLYEKAGL